MSHMSDTRESGPESGPHRERDEFLGVTFEESAETAREVASRRAVGERREKEARAELSRLGGELGREDAGLAHVASGEEQVDRFVERGTPEYVRTRRERGTVTAKLLGALVRAEGMDEARERLPKSGPFLAVANHSGGETGPLLALLKDRDAHIAAADELNFKRSGFRSWLLKKLRMIPVKETLSNLSDGEKTALLERVPGRAKKGYGKVVEREREGEVAMNNDFLRASVALLARGDVVVTFPEGLFLYDGKRSLRKAYGGVELVARRYKQLTGKDLPIVPIALVPARAGSKRRIAVGEAAPIAEGAGVDSVMERLAELMPEDLRGAYSKAEK